MKSSCLQNINCVDWLLCIVIFGWIPLLRAINHIQKQMNSHKLIYLVVLQRCIHFYMTDQWVDISEYQLILLPYFHVFFNLPVVLAFDVDQFLSKILLFRFSVLLKSQKWYDFRSHWHQPHDVTKSSESDNQRSSTSTKITKEYFVCARNPCKISIKIQSINVTMKDL